MTLYMKKSPIYYTIFIQGFKDKNGWYLSNEDEIDEFAKKFNMDWHWNMRHGVLDFKDKSEGVTLNRPWNVKIGQVVVAYDDWGTWRVDLWDLEAFEKQFIGVNEQKGN